MTLLNSPEFKGDAALEACAKTDTAHIVPGAVGPHVGKIQDALNRVDNAGIGAAERGPMRYGTATANAVTRFKTKRNILNYQGRIDPIVGIKTILALDRELRGLSLGLENATDQTRYTDVFVRFVGGSTRDGGEEAIDRVKLPESYQKDGKRSLKGICRGADKNRPSQVQSAFDEIMRLRKTGSIGLLCIRGSSLGGIWALELAEKLTRQEVPIQFLSLQDAAFSTTDAINLPDSRFQSGIYNIPLFNGRGVKADIKISHFQKVGNKAEYSFRQNKIIWASDLDGEIHGEVTGFQSRLWSNVDRSDAGLAHNQCCGHAERADLATLAQLLEQLHG